MPIQRDSREAVRHACRQRAVTGVTQADQFLLVTRNAEGAQIEALCDSEWLADALLELGRQFPVMASAIGDVAALLYLDTLGKPQRPNIEEDEP